MSDAIKIETKIDWNGGPTFMAGSSEAVPIEVTGLGNLKNYPNAWSPPHLLVSAVETCFLATLFHTLEKARIKLTSYSSTATGELTESEGTSKEISKLTLKIEAGLENPADQDKARRLMDLTEKYCYVSRSVGFSVSLDVKFI